MEHYKIDDTDIFIEEIAPNKGKITISNTSGHNYSTSWGAMGGTLKDFLCHINEDYFVSNLMGVSSSQVMNVKKTFKHIRDHISTEMGMNWYKFPEFQKDMRRKLSEFQKECEEIPDDRYFVNAFYSFINSLDFGDINDSFEGRVIEKEFRQIEPWHFIIKGDSDKAIWLKKLHGKIKKELLKEKKYGLING